MSNPQDVWTWCKARIAPSQDSDIVRAAWDKVDDAVRRWVGGRTPNNRV